MYKKAVRRSPPPEGAEIELEGSEISFQPMKDMVFLHETSMQDQRIETVDEESPSEGADGRRRRGSTHR